MVMPTNHSNGNDAYDAHLMSTYVPAGPVDATVHHIGPVVCIRGEDLEAGIKKKFGTQHFQI